MNIQNCVCIAGAGQPNTQNKCSVIVVILRASEIITAFKHEY